MIDYIDLFNAIYSSLFEAFDIEKNILFLYHFLEFLEWTYLKK
jgi:hypothetical protein